MIDRNICIYDSHFKIHANHHSHLGASDDGRYHMSSKSHLSSHPLIPVLSSPQLEVNFETILEER